MANPVLGKSLCSDWFFRGQDFAVWTVSMETVQSVYFCFGAKPANSTFATKTAKKKRVVQHTRTESGRLFGKDDPSSGSRVVVFAEVKKQEIVF